MAAASGLATSLAAAAAEPFLCRSSPWCSTPSSSCAVPSPDAFPRRGIRISQRHTDLVARGRRGVKVGRVFPRCEAAADQGAETGLAVAAADAASASASDRSSSLSALELLKVSAGDRYTKERSSVAVIGLSVHTAPVEMREKLAVPEAQWHRAIAELSELNHIEEAAVLSTCKRIWTKFNEYYVKRWTKPSKVSCMDRNSPQH